MKNYERPRRPSRLKLGENGCRKKSKMVEGPSGMSYYDHLKKAAKKDPGLNHDIRKLYNSQGYRRNGSTSSYDL